MTASYYNENDPFAAQWLRNLIAARLIAPGEVDERSILEVKASDLRGYTQCHFFAGIGVWSHALRSAGWPDDRPVWTGSCPCQPWSPAGRRKGHEDERHLWPAWRGLIVESKPVVVFGEQVADGGGAAWFDHVASDLEGLAYSVGAVRSPACGYGAPHERERLYFVADADQERRARHAAGQGRPPWGSLSARHGEDGGLADSGGQRRQQERRGAPGHEEADRSARRLERQPHGHHVASGNGQDHAGAVADDAGGGRDSRGFARAPRETEGEGQRPLGADAHGQLGGLGDAAFEGPSEQRRGRHESARSATAGFWRDAEWLPFSDGKARPVEPGSFPLAHGVAGRVGRLRAYGNALVAPQAAEFIRAYLAVRGA